MLVGGRITRVESDLKQVSETGSGQVYEIQANHDGQPDGRLHEETKQRLGSRADRFETKNSRLRRQNARITSGVIMANARVTKLYCRKRASFLQSPRTKKKKENRSEFSCTVI